MPFRDIFEELHRDLESIRSVLLSLLENMLFPEEAVIEKDTQQTIPKNNLNKSLNKNLSSDKTHKQTG